MKHSWRKSSSPSTSIHRPTTTQQRRTPRFKKKTTSTFLHGLFTSASAPICTRTKPRVQQETLKKLFLVETPPRRRQARRCQLSSKSRRKPLSSSINSHTSTGVVSPKRTAYSFHTVASPRRSLAGQAPVVLSPDVSSQFREAGPDVDRVADVAYRDSVNPNQTTFESSQRLDRLADLRREAYRDLALSTQTYNDALVLRMRHLESLSWEDQRSWVRSLGDSNSFGAMVGANISNWDGNLMNDGDVIVMGDDDVDVDVLIDLMDGTAGNVKDYEELLEFERGVMKHDVDEANWVGDLW